jgi:hypothetical protein
MVIHLSFPKSKKRTVRERGKKAISSELKTPIKNETK